MKHGHRVSPIGRLAEHAYRPYIPWRRTGTHGGGALDCSTIGPPPVSLGFVLNLRKSVLPAGTVITIHFHSVVLRAK
jgi:hypothetical protein